MKASDSLSHVLVTWPASTSSILTLEVGDPFSTPPSLRIELLEQAVYVHTDLIFPNQGITMEVH